MPVWLAALAGVARADDPVVPDEDEPALPMPGAPDPGPPDPPAPEPASTDDDEPAGRALVYDPLLITTVQPESPDVAADAEALEALLVARFGASSPLVPMSEVPAFEVQGYDARTYALGCPPGRYAGCALVLGQRAGVERTVGATLRRGPDPDHPDVVVRIATFHMVDVSDGREVVSVEIPMPEGSDEEVVGGLLGVYGDVVDGDRALRDLRDREDPDAKALADARKEQLAKALDRLEQRLGTAVVSEAEIVIRRPKVTRAELAEYQQRDDQPPWERLGMGMGEYVRFANSGRTVDDWRASGWGRTASLLVRVGGGLGPGPWDQRYEGKVLRSNQDLQPIATAQRLELVRGSAPAFDFEVGVGVLPFLELDFAGSVRPGASSYGVDEDVEGQVPVPQDGSTVQISTWHFGPRAHLAPFPRWPARPTLGAGLAFWSGAGIPATDVLPRMEAPTRTFLEVLPGVEVDASPHIAPFLRALVSVPVGGTPVRTASSGQGGVVAPEAGPDAGAGVTVQVGLQVRLGPVVRPRPSGPAMR